MNGHTEKQGITAKRTEGACVLKKVHNYYHHTGENRIDWHFSRVQSRDMVDYTIVINGKTAPGGKGSTPGIGGYGGDFEEKRNGRDP